MEDVEEEDLCPLAGPASEAMMPQQHAGMDPRPEPGIQYTNDSVALV
jgi:hypothetical protein